MKALHRSDMFAWSVFNPERDLDFHGYAWIRERGNVLIDPVQMSDHDREHLHSLGGAAWIVITNSSHVRAAPELAEAFGAALAGPAAEKEDFQIPCQRWLSDGEELVPGLKVIELDGSKTPGELALLLDGTTLITGDLIRGHRGGSLNLLPDAKLANPAKARDSVRRLLAYPDIEAVLVGDGWPTFRDGHTLLRKLQ
jgi:hypothetical protein